MKKILSLIFLSAATLLSFQEAKAQSFRYANEALTFSRPVLTGTARMQGMGGAHNSLGGDLSSAYTNPAGLGFYNRSEISFSPTYFSSANDATYLGTGNYNYRNKLNISNFGIVISGRKMKEEGWMGGNFAFTYQQLNNFNDRFTYNGVNPDHGLINVLIDNYATNAPDLLTDLAYSTYLVGDYNDNGQLVYSLAFPPTPEYPVTQMETVERSGRNGQYNFAYGGNFNDQFYIGASIGVAEIDYRLDKTYTETFSPGDDVTSFEILEAQMVKGGGLNATLGIIARPASFLSLGLSYATPTIYSLEEEYSTTLTAIYNNIEISEEVLDGYEGDPFTLTNSSETDVSVYNYNLRTPGKLAVGGTFFFNKLGFITTDVEFIDYSKNRLTDNTNSLQEDNEAIQEDYTSAVNFKIGGELRKSVFRLRGGFAHFGDPYSQRDGMDRFTQSVTGGAGLRFKNYFIDFALTHQLGERYYIPYSFGSDTPMVSMDNRTTKGILSLGFTF